MDNSNRRINLPSGGWWEIEPRPRWKHVCAWAGQGEPSPSARALVSLTAAWSFGDPISLESLARRDAGDLIAALEVFQQEVVPFLESASPRQMAEELFGALVAGCIPPQFADVHLMAATGWSWQTLQDTPVDVVQKMAVYLAVAEARKIRGSLDFGEQEEESP